MPVGPGKPGVLDAGAVIGAGVPGLAAVLHVSAAHRLQGGQRKEGLKHSRWKKQLGALVYRCKLPFLQET